MARACVFLPKCFLLLVVLFIAVSAQDARRKELLDKLKKLRPKWVVGHNPDVLPVNYSQPGRKVKTMCPKCPLVIPKGTINPPPRFFDSRNKWKSKCKDILNRVRHQGQCASDWAVSFVSLVSDRMCISSDGKDAVHLSAEHVMNCCKDCVFKGNHGCQGGDVPEAAKYWKKKGIVTGGEVGSNEGCMPYSKESFDGMNVECSKNCTNKHYKTSKNDDRHKGGQMYTVPPEESAIRKELYSNGPVMSKITVYEDLEFYRGGVYKHILGDSQGIQYLKIIGYGVEDRENYWFCACSFGVKYGHEGYLKILRGVNHCKIEEHAVTVTLGDVPSRKTTTESTSTETTETESTETTEETEETEDPDERRALASDAKMLEASIIRHVLAKIMFFCLYFHSQIYLEC